MEREPDGEYWWLFAGLLVIILVTGVLYAWLI